MTYIGDGRNWISSDYNKEIREYNRVRALRKNVDIWKGRICMCSYRR